MYKAIVVGVSGGGMNALSKIFSTIPKDFRIPMIIVQHRKDDHEGYLVEYLNNLSDINVVEAKLRESIKPKSVYVCPPGYHLLVERDETFSLSVDPPVCYAIPSIDVLFESAAYVYQEKLVGVVLTGANSDGSKGLKTIKQYGGLAVVQDPKTAEFLEMPSSAIKIVNADHIVPIDEMGMFLKGLEDK